MRRSRNSRDEPMNFPPARQICRPLLALAAILVLAASSSGPAAYAGGPIRKAKVGDHKVKVKTFGGKATIKNKPSGKEQVKIKGPNGEYAAEVAYSAIAPPWVDGFPGQPVCGR